MSSKDTVVFQIFDFTNLNITGSSVYTYVSFAIVVILFLVTNHNNHFRYFHVLLKYTRTQFQK